MTLDKTSPGKTSLEYMSYMRRIDGGKQQVQNIDEPDTIAP
jgi:hypothetical protein